MPKDRYARPAVVRTKSNTQATAAAAQRWSMETSKSQPPAARSAFTAHSARNDSIGSTRAARRAGAQLARAATPSRSADTARKVRGSAALTS